MYAVAYFTLMFLEKIQSLSLRTFTVEKKTTTLKIPTET